MRHTIHLAVIGALQLCVCLTSCVTPPVAAFDVVQEVEQHPAPGGLPGRLLTYTGSDDTELAYVAYTAPSARTALVYLHGIESHAGWFALAAARLQQQGLPEPQDTSPDNSDVFN